MIKTHERTTVSTVLYWIFGVVLILHFLMMLTTQVITLNMINMRGDDGFVNYTIYVGAVISVLAKLTITISYFLRSGAICWILPFEILATTGILTTMMLEIPVIFVILIVVHIIVFALIGWLLYYLIKHQEIRRP